MSVLINHYQPPKKKFILIDISWMFVWDSKFLSPSWSIPRIPPTDKTCILFLSILTAPSLTPFSAKPPTSSFSTPLSTSNTPPVPPTSLNTSSQLTLEHLPILIWEARGAPLNFAGRQFARDNCPPLSWAEHCRLKAFECFYCLYY